MKTRRSRLALVGVLALASCMAVGLVSGSVADAKKKGKGKGKGGSSVTVSRTTATTVPPSVDQPPGCTQFAVPNPNPCTGPQIRSFVSVPLAVGKKAKGKVVSPDSVSVTFTLTGDPKRPGPPTTFPVPQTDIPAGASSLELSLTAPNGRTIALENTPDPNATTIGPLTETPDSPFTFCGLTFAFPSPATSSCAVEDPEATVRPPTWVGTIGVPDLADFNGIPAMGTWAFKARNLSTMTTGVVSSVSVRIGLQAGASSGAGKKK
jgi:hypothetical protein